MIQSIAFDLDDTLLDTSGLLVPKASIEACLAIMSAGTKCTLEECLQLRKELSQSLSHFEIFGRIVDEFHCPERDLAIQMALREFYSPQIPEKLPLIEGARQNLEFLHKKYTLFLVTMGVKEAQEKKIKALQIDSFFKKIYILDSLRNEHKITAFNDIILHEGHSPKKLLCIGNRISAEIRDGKRMGGKTCHFLYGEHMLEPQKYPEDIPDFTISSHYDLIKTCQL